MVFSSYSFSSTSCFLNDLIANNSFESFFSQSITLPNAPLPRTLITEKSYIEILVEFDLFLLNIKLIEPF